MFCKEFVTGKDRWMMLMDDVWMFDVYGQDWNQNAPCGLHFGK